MTRVEFADTVILNMGYNDVDKKLDRRQVYADMDIYLPMILCQYAKKEGEGILNNFTVNQVLNVLFDSGRARFYLDVPVPMNLGGFAGIRQIGDTQNEDQNYVPIQSSFNSIASFLEVGGLAGRVGFFLDGNRAYFKNTPVVMPPKMRVTYVPTIRGLSDDQQITCPADTMSLLCDKLTEILMLQRTTPENVVNDNKDNQS